MGKVAIYFLDKGFPVVAWLCEKCVAKRRADGWGVMDCKTVPHTLTCDDCHKAARA